VRVIRLGTRASALARWQSDHVAARLASHAPDVHIEIVEITSDGDVITDVPLSHVEGTGFFTSTLEHALLAGEIDVAVHSHKDLPVERTPGLIVAAVPARGPVEDVLCARSHRTLSQLPEGARVGTCSARRAAQIHALRSDLHLHDLRGNVPTRVARVGAGDLDAIVLARAGLARLNLTQHISELFSVERVMPAPAQGALAVQCREDDHRTCALLGVVLDDPSTHRAVRAERTLLHALGGGCSVPVGASAQAVGRHLMLSAGVFSMDPARSVRLRRLGDEPERLGEAAAARLLALGADVILAEFDRAPAIAAAAGGH
jgi:hydroxymethylbilane synthase